MEGAQPQPFGGIPKQKSHAGFHFTGGFVGEGNREDVVGRHTGLADQVGDAVGEDAGFTRTRTCQDESLPGGGGDGEALLGVETGENIHSGRIVPPPGLPHRSPRLLNR